MSTTIQSPEAPPPAGYTEEDRVEIERLSALFMAEASAARVAVRLSALITAYMNVAGANGMLVNAAQCLVSAATPILLQHMVDMAQADAQLPTTPPQVH